MVPYKIFNQTLAGSEVPYTLPTEAIRSVAFQANGGDVTMACESGGDTWKIADGSKEALNNVNLSGVTFYFNGTATLEIRVEYGTAS